MHIFEGFVPPPGQLSWANRRDEPFSYVAASRVPLFRPREKESTVSIFAKNAAHADLPDLIEAAQHSKADDTPAMNEIIRKFEGLTQRLARSMTKSPYLQDDLANAARVALVRAVRRHDQRRAGFPAYAEKYMRGAVLREYQKWILPEIPHSEIVEGADGAPGVEHPQEHLLDEIEPWGSGRVATSISELTPSQRQIASLRYVEDASLQDIAATTSTTASAVSQRLATIHRKVEQAIAA
jgi:RNA polymerase sigma factor (sigma-70 family)